MTDHSEIVGSHIPMWRPEEDTELHNLPLVADCKLLNKYAIFDKLGAGAMGVVYAAVDLTNKRVCAVKCLLSCWKKENSAVVDRFELEGVTQRAVKDDNVVEYFDNGEERGVKYVVMEYVDGESLEQRLLRLGRALNWEEAVVLVRMLGRGLSQIHECGIVHRDITPRNILITSPGCAKLSDFSIARVARWPSYITTSGQVLGTKPFRPPEQDIDAGTADFSADIYSLVATICYALTRETWTSASTLRGLISRFPERIPGFPREVSAVFQKCTADSPSERLQDSQQFLRAFEGCLPTNQVSGPSVSGLPFACPKRQLTVPGEQILHKLRQQAAQSTMDQELKPNVPVRPVKQSGRRRLISAAILLIPACMGYYWEFGQSLDKHRSLNAENTGTGKRDTMTAIHPVPPPEAAALSERFRTASLRLQELAIQAVAEGRKAEARTLLKTAIDLDNNREAKQMLDQMQSTLNSE